MEPTIALHINHRVISKKTSKIVNQSYNKKTYTKKS